MTNLQSLYNKRKVLYQKLQAHERKQALAKTKARIYRQELGNQLEELKDLIALEKGELALERSLATHIDTQDLADWLKLTYAGSDALAAIAAATVRRDYQMYLGQKVNAPVFKRAMRELGFENRLVRVVNGGGYVARAWCKIVSP